VRFRLSFAAALLMLGASVLEPDGVAAQGRADAVPQATLLRILEAEDQRRWDAALFGRWLSDTQAAVRQRAALAAGRIGDPAAVGALAARLSDASVNGRLTAAFALGEIEAESAAAPLLAALQTALPAEMRGRTLEALGKVGALHATSAALKARIGQAIVDTLTAERRQAVPGRQDVLPGLTAAVRARVDGSSAAVALFLDAGDPRLKAAVRGWDNSRICCRCGCGPRATSPSGTICAASGSR
jgi:hypothetical protein